MVKTKCPLCKSEVEIDVDFAIKNKRVFCTECCRAFDVEIDEKPTYKSYSEMEYDDEEDDFEF